MAQRPGIMLYFSVRPALKRLSAEQKGQLFDAILDYGECGLLPDFDGVLGVCWDFIQPMIDKDAENYREKCDKAKKAVETRWAKKGDTDVYERISPNTEHTNNNNNSNDNSNHKDNFNSMAKTNTDTMSAAAGVKGNCDNSAIRRDGASAPPATGDFDFDELDFEEKRRIALQRIAESFGD